MGHARDDDRGTARPDVGAAITPAPRTEPGVLRLFRFRPAHPSFDSILRDVMVPDLLSRTGLEAVFVGRQGPGDVGERLVATIWESEAAMVEAVGRSFDPPIFHPEHIDDTVEKRLDILPLAYAFGGPSSGGSVLRLLDGEARQGELGRYVDHVREGTQRDAEGSRGPRALYLAAAGDDRFATLSVWGRWSKVAEATGGSVEDPRHTRHHDLLAGWTVAHYEAVVCEAGRGAGQPEVRSAERSGEPDGPGEGELAVVS
jgi:hypothetical protein